jgi:histidine ammonia-lyase
VPFIDHDRVFADDINAIHQLVTGGALLAKAAEFNLFQDDEFGIY